MTDEQIVSELYELVRNERKISTRILILINLAEDRELHLVKAYGDILKWLVGEFKYSETAAYRRMRAARVLRAVPELVGDLIEGAQNLSKLAQAQSVFQAEEKVSKRKLSREQKAEAMSKTKNKSAKDAHRDLLKLFPKAELEPKGDYQMRESAESTRLYVSFGEEAMQILEELRNEFSHIYPNGKFEKIFVHLATSYGKNTRSSTAAVNRCVSFRAAKKSAMERAGKACEFIDHETGRRCCSKYQVQIDHIQPKAMGGTDEPENLRVLCRKHNIFMSEKNLGKEKANEWRMKT